MRRRLRLFLPLLAFSPIRFAMVGGQPMKRSRVASARYEFWPSDLKRAGHTSVEVPMDSDLGRHLDESGKHEVHGIHMARMQKLPCQLIKSQKFRNGRDRWWCPIHQGVYGKIAEEKLAKETGVECCDQSGAFVDFVRSSEVMEVNLVKPEEVRGENDYCELGIWIGLAPAIDTFNKEAKHFYVGIHVQAHKEVGGPKVLDKSFPAVRIKDHTGRFPNIPSEGILVTSPAALEYLYYMELQCPVNAELGVESLESQGVPRSKVELTAIVRCSNCQALHEDIGDFFGAKLHKKHLCGTCGRDIRLEGIGNPLHFLRRPWRREIVGERIDPHNKTIHIKSSEHRLMCWPSTPALFWSRDAPESWGIRVHGFNAQGERVIDGTYGTVYVDGQKLDRAKLFGDMLNNSSWMVKDAEKRAVAQELEGF